MPVYKDWYLGSDGYFMQNAQKIGVFFGDATYYYSDQTTVAESSEESERYFKVEPIVCSVIDEDYNGAKKALLCPWFGLTLNVPFFGVGEERTLGDATIYPNNYKYSNIRSYLNGKQNQFVLDGGTATQPDID